MINENIIVEMTPFLFEDGNTYYFNITKRRSSSDYHDLWVYRKVVVDCSNWFRKKTREEYHPINSSPELISIRMDVNEIKKDIKKIIQSNKACIQIEGWDGFVGDIPKDRKLQMMRDSKLDQII